MKKVSQKPSKKLSLKTQLFLPPVMLLVFAFITLYFTFNFAMGAYVRKITSDSIAEEFNFIEEYYSDAERFAESAVYADNTLALPVNHIIVDKDGRVLSDGFYDMDERQAYENSVVEYFAAHKDLLSDGKTAGFSARGRSYFYKVRYFDISSSFLKARASGNDSCYAIVFVDIGAIELLKKSLHIILALSMMLVAVPAIYISVSSSRKTDRSIAKLKACIEQLGKREDIHAEPLEYREFDEMLDTICDISEQLDQADSSRRIFFQNASHELRTPLMSIQGYAESIQKRIGEDPAESAAIILSESRKMKRLVDDILTLSRIETGSERLEIESFDVREMIDSCIGSIEKSASEKNISIICDFSAPLMIAADENKLSHALINILSNAVRYAKTKIEIWYYKESPGDRAVISVRNDGERIEPSELPHIFERFYKGKGGNFGIGLSMAKEIVALHKGEIRTESLKEKTTFFISIPQGGNG